MADPRHQLGRRGEELAAKYMKRRGFFILERNWKIQHSRKWWEIDIIAEKRSGIWPFWRKRTIVFIEVKTMRLSGQSGHFSNVQKKEIGHSPFHPELQVNNKRQKRLIRAAEMYLSKNAISPHSDWQIDVIGIMIDPVTDDFVVRRTERAVSDVL